MSKKKINLTSTAFIIALAVILVALNLLAALIPSRYTQLDVSGNRLFSISNESKRFLNELDTETQIFVINADGSLLPVERIISLFDQNSTNLNVSYSLPDDELTAMGVDNIDSVPAYTLVVKGKYRTSYILPNEIYYYTNDTYHDLLGEMSASEYSSLLQTVSEYASLNEYYQEMLQILWAETKVHLDFESILLSRIEYVSEEYIPHPYYLTGHGELSMTESVFGSSLVGYFGCEALDLSTVDTLPVDVASLIINSPENDYSEKETEIISKYLENGGSILLITSPENAGMPNLMSIVEQYGARTTSDIVALDRSAEESDEENADGEEASDSGEAPENEDSAADDELSEYEKYLLIPNVNQDHDALYALAGQYPYVFKTNHIEIAESDQAVIIEKLLTVSDAYLDGVEDSVGEKTLAVAIEKATDNGSAKVIWFTGGESFSDAMLHETTFYMAVYSLDWCSLYFESQIDDIEAKLMNEAIFTTNDLAYYGLPALFVVIVPVAIALTGMLVIKKRKSRKPIE